MTTRHAAAAAMLSALALVTAGCNPKPQPEPSRSTAAPVKTPAEPSKPFGTLGLREPRLDRGHPNWKLGVPRPDPFPAAFDPTKDYFATIHTTLGDVTVKFMPELAPRHVTSFIYLSELGYYDDVPFHRVCSGFMMQGGDPLGQGNGGPNYKIPAEFNDTKHVRGILSMARTNDPNSGGSQFFLMFDKADFLDHKYTVFGRTVEGLDVIGRFEKEVAVQDPSGRCPPKSLEKIKTVDVFTKDKS